MWEADHSLRVSPSTYGPIGVGRSVVLQPNKCILYAGGTRFELLHQMRLAGLTTAGLWDVRLRDSQSRWRKQFMHWYPDLRKTSTLPTGRALN